MLFQEYYEEDDEDGSYDPLLDWQRSSSPVSPPPPPLIWDKSRILELSGLTVIEIVGLVGNLVIAYTLVKRKLLKYPSNRLVLNLNLSSFFFHLLVSPFSFTIVIQSSQFDWNLGPFWCKLSGFIFLLTYSVCGPTLAFLAIDRYVAIVKPMRYPNLMTLARSSVLAGVAWIMALVLALLPFFLSSANFVYEKHMRSCTVAWDGNKIYTFIHLSFTFWAPFVILCFCYFYIFKVALNKSQKINISLTTLDTFLETTDNKDVYNPSVRRSQTVPAVLSNKELPLRTSLSTSAISTKIPRKLPSYKRPSLSWIQYWSPKKGFLTICAFIVSFIATFLPEVVVHTFDLSQDWSDFLISVSSWSIRLSYCSYPFIYGVMNRAIRKEILPALMPNPAMRGLPRSEIRNMNQFSRRISMPVFSLSYSSRERKASSCILNESPTLKRSMLELRSSLSLSASIIRQISEPTPKESSESKGNLFISNLEKVPMILITPAPMKETSRDSGISELDVTGINTKYLTVDEIQRKSSRVKKRKSIDEGIMDYYYS